MEGPHSVAGMRSFDLLGHDPPASPVVLSVPHAGRDYPPDLLAAIRVPAAALTVLEDRHVDAVALAARDAETTLIQRTPRAWIDLNRAEDERDPQVDDGARARAAPHRSAPHPSAKVRSGLGLVPRRAGAAGDLWRRRFSDAEVAERIAAHHRPYHATLAAALAAAQARFGVAVLLDLHSMPSLPGPDPARVVIGDRFGRSAAARLVARVEAAAAAHGLKAVLNAPYAGGHLADRHARPTHGLHAIQMELDRSLYLAPGLGMPGPGLARTAALVRATVAALADEALAMAATGALPVAAE